MREVSGKLSIDLGYLHTTREFDLHVENFDCASDESIAIAIQLAPWKAQTWEATKVAVVQISLLRYSWMMWMQSARQGANGASLMPVKVVDIDAMFGTLTVTLAPKRNSVQ